MGFNGLCAFRGERLPVLDDPCFADLPDILEDIAERCSWVVVGKLSSQASDVGTEGIDLARKTSLEIYIF